MLAFFLVYNNVHFELPYSIPSLTNKTNQAITSSLTALTTPVPNTTTVKGTWNFLSINNVNELFYVHPNYGIRAFVDTNYASGVANAEECLNFQNNTNNPVLCRQGQALFIMELYQVLEFIIKE